MAQSESAGTTFSGEIAVLERRPWWTPELQRQFLGTGVRVRSGSSFRDLRSLLTPEIRVLAIEFDVSPAECLQWLGGRAGIAAECPAIVIGTEQTAEFEWLVRELGATDFVPETIGGRALAALCRKQFVRLPAWQSETMNVPSERRRTIQ